MGREQRFGLALAWAAGGVLVLHLVFAYLWPAWGWGVHHLRSFPHWMRIGLPVLGVALVVPPVARGLTSRNGFRLWPGSARPRGECT